MRQFSSFTSPFSYFSDDDGVTSLVALRSACAALLLDFFRCLDGFRFINFRWGIAAIILGIQIGSVAVLGFVTHFIMRLSKRLRET